MGCAVSEGTKILTLHSCYHPLKNLQNMLMNQQNTFQILCAPKIYDSKSLSSAHFIQVFWAVG